MTRKTFHSSLLIFIFMVFNGCFLFQPRGKQYDPKDPTRSTVYGYIDLKDAPTSLDWVLIKQFLPKPEQYWSTKIIDNNIFVSVVIPKGSFQVYKFGGENLFTKIVYDFGTSGRNRTAIRIKKPGLIFVGAYKYQKVKTGFFEQDKFKMIHSKSPSEREITKKLLKYFVEEDKVKYSRQIKMLKRRLRRLR